MVDAPPVRRALSSAAALMAVLCLSATAVAAPPGLEPPDAATVAEARRIVEAMRRNPRGPYEHLRWFCADGTVHPPRPYPCQERGGGVQHGQYSEARKRLAELGWHVGTVFTATRFDELWSKAERQARLRELALERYLIDVADGWVMERARTYRGHVQVEDEERAGREILEKLLARREWVTENFLVAREMARTIPHRGGAEDRTREVRRLSKELAEADPTFETTRITIHTRPSAADIRATRDWIAAAGERNVEAEQLAKARRLVEGLEAIYSPTGRIARLERAARAFRGEAFHDALDRSLSGLSRATPEQRVGRLAETLLLARRKVVEGVSPATALALLDLSVDAEGELVSAAQEVLAARRTRGELARLAGSLAEAAHGAGFLTRTELEALQSEIAPLTAARSLPVQRYLEAARALERSGAWALGAVRHAFAEPLTAYVALEPKAAQFPDDLLRGSAMLPLADVAGLLARDAERAAGVEHSLFGVPADGLAGLNSGVALGRLRVLTEGELARGVEPGEDEIVVLPRTVAELSPVAGILSVGQGNALSHVQLLARNLGIPNATVPPARAEALRRRAGETVLFAVGPQGSVVLAERSRVPADLAAELEDGGRAERGGVTVDRAVEVETPDLSVRRPLVLDELHAGLSGRVVGPKAANVGELARQFPGRVAPAVAIPFGVFAEHAGGDGGPVARLQRAHERHRRGEIGRDALQEELDAVRHQVEALRLRPGFRAELERAMERELGAPGTYGVFVRSDTNVEDLAGFTGAGLNRTLPHVVDPRAQLEGVATVWASPFERRAMAWRSRVLENPWEVYPSVLLMKSVPADASGVLVTDDVATGGEGLTVAMAHGVGGAVGGEEAEVVVLRPDGSVTRISEAKAPWQRRLSPSGGIEWVPAPAGPVLSAAEIEEIRRFASELDRRLVPERGPDGRPLPWDVELGFDDGRLALFQVRPLVERGTARAERAVAALVPGGGARAASVDLTRAPTR